MKLILFCSKNIHYKECKKKHLSDVIKRKQKAKAKMEVASDESYLHRSVNWRGANRAQIEV